MRSCSRCFALAFSRAFARALALLLALVAGAAPARAEAKRTFAGSLQLDYLAVPTEPHARGFTLDGATVELSLKLTAEVSSYASVSVKACFACHGFEAGMAFVELRHSDELLLRVGRMTPSFGSFPQRSDPANHRASDKPLPYDMGRMLRREEWNEGILPAPWVDNGIELGGTHFFQAGQLDYAVYLMSGPRGSAEVSDFDFIASRSPDLYYIDNNSQPMIGGRIAGSMELRGHGTLQLGGSFMAGTYDPETSLAFAIGGADAVLDLRKIIFRGEYLIERTGMALGDDPATRFKFGPSADGTFDDHFWKHGYYVEGEVPLEDVDLFGRVDGLYRAGNVLAQSALAYKSSVVRFTAGGALRFGTIRLKSSIEYYRFSDFDDELALHVGLATAF